MPKRTITLTSKTYKKTIGKKVTVSYDSPLFKLKQTMIKTDLGYFDVSILLDRKGRLNEVVIEKSKYA